jgi:hypothetical protein
MFNPVKKFYRTIFLLCFFQIITGALAGIISQTLPEPVQFSIPGGFYTEQFVLELYHPDPDARIYFSLDGSVPDPENINGKTYLHVDRYQSDQQVMLEKKYTTYSYDIDSPIIIRNRSLEENYFSRMQTSFEAESVPYYYPLHSIFIGTVVRAIAVVNNQASSAETHTYFVSEEGRNRYSLPVIAITVQEDELFDYHKGIYVPGFLYDQNNPYSTRGDAVANYTQRGIEWERRVTVELFEPASSIPDLKQDAGIRIHGGWSRSNPMKSLRLYARSDYGENRFRHQMFPGEPYSDYNRLILRNGGNDWPEAMMRDPLLQGLVKHMKFDTQAYRPFVVFLNGEYWGIHNMRERYDKHYLSRRHGVDPDKIDHLTGNAQVVEGSNRHYRETIQYIRDQNLADDEHYEYIKTRIDIENYIDYLIAKIFVANTDWPGNNIEFWRYQTDRYEPDAPYQHDGRWRWLAIDMDFGFHLYYGCPPESDGCATPDHNTLAFASRDDGVGWPNPPWSTELFRSLLENQNFRKQFILRYQDQLNTAFLPGRIKDEIHRVAGHLEPEMHEHLERWFSGREWHHFNRWKYLVENRIIPFAEHRSYYARQHLKDFFGLGDSYRLTVDVSDPATGYVQINTIQIKAETPGVGKELWPWSGSFFQDFPVRLKAVAFPGYHFSHWEGEKIRYHQPVLNLELKEALQVKAVYYPDAGKDSETFPKPFSLREGAYFMESWPGDIISEWPYNDPESGYPANMAFVYMDREDPGLDAEIAGYTEGLYNLNSRTRIIGLGDDGFAFINTSNGNVGFPDTRLGGAILALNTRRLKNIVVRWDGITVLPNSRVYNIRLQYRTDDSEPFRDLPDQNGNPVEYKRNEVSGHRVTIGPVRLPAEAENKSYIQLFWRYYHNSVQEDPSSGQRSQMAVANIIVEAIEILDEELDLIYPASLAVFQNYPNPFNSTTVLSFQIPHEGDVKLEIFDMLGRRIETLYDGYRAAGEHYLQWDAAGRSTGIYIVRLQYGQSVESRTITLVK